MSDNEKQEGELQGFLVRHPTLQYLLLGALGGIGVYLALPIGLEPRSNIEWFDLVINVVILVPSAALLVVGATLAALSGFTSLDEHGPSARFTRTVLRTIGVPRAVIPGFEMLGPFGLLMKIFWDKYREDSPPELKESNAEEDL